MKLDALKTREKFLVLEIVPGGANGLFLSIDEDRTIIFEKFLEGMDLKKFVKSPAQSVGQKAWEGKHLFKSRRKIIAIADPSIATTIPIPIDLRRDKTLWKEKITLAEYENLIAQAMAKIFNQCREEAAKRLATSDLDAILVEAKVSQIKLDGKAIEDPAGEVGKKISLLLELTFTSRECFEVLKQFFNAPDGFFFAEAPQVRLAALARVHPLPLNLLVAQSDKKASLFILEKTRDDHPVLYRELIDWDVASFVAKITEALHISHAAAEELYTKYLAGAMSAAVARHFQKMIEPAIEELLSHVGRAKLKGNVYIDTPYGLPFELPYRHGGATIATMPMQEMMDMLGFTIDKEKLTVAPHIVARYLAPFFEAYFDKSDSEINKKLRRRLHWLTE